MDKKLFWRTNEQIRAPEVRVVDEKGLVGVMDIKKALELAREKKLDIIEIAPQAKPPVVRLEDFGKFRYREEKKARKARAKKSDIKEVRFTPFIGDADYKTRVERIKEFLGGGDKVRLVVRFKGRQMDARKFGYELLKRLTDGFADEINIDSTPKFIGRHLAMVISPTSKVKKQDAKNENQEISHEKV